MALRLEGDPASITSTTGGSAGLTRTSARYTISAWSQSAEEATRCIPVRFVNAQRVSHRLLLHWLPKVELPLAALPLSPAPAVALAAAAERERRTMA